MSAFCETFLNWSSGCRKVRNMKTVQTILDKGRITGDTKSSVDLSSQTFISVMLLTELELQLPIALITNSFLSRAC